MRYSERMVELFSIVHHLQHRANMQHNQRIKRVTISNRKKTKKTKKKRNSLKQDSSCFSVD